METEKFLQEIADGVWAWPFPVRAVLLRELINFLKDWFALNGCGDCSRFNLEKQAGRFKGHETRRIEVYGFSNNFGCLFHILRHFRENLLFEICARASGSSGHLKSFSLKQKFFRVLNGYR